MSRAFRWTLGTLFLVALVLVTLEVGLRTIMGFGSPILYDNTYAWGYRPLPNQRTKRTKGVEVRINDRGLRASRDWPAERKPGEIRLLYLGDSVTYGGSYVGDPETFVERSAARIASDLHRDVLAGNGGVNGWGPKNILGLIGRCGTFGADVVVVVVLEGDLDRPLGHMPETPYWNHRPASAIEEVLSSYVVFRLNTRRFLTKDHFVSTAEQDSARRAGIGEYLEIGQRLQAQGAKVLMAWHPSRAAAEGTTPDADRQEFLARCAAAGLPTLDLEPALRARKDVGGLYVDPMHLHARGHAVYGDLLAAAVENLLRGS